jgi:hypothetical protein
MTNTNNLPTLAAAAADALGTAHGRLAAAQFHGSLESITRAAAALDAALPAWTRALELAGLETRGEMAARAEARCEAAMAAATRAYRRAV